MKNENTKNGSEATALKIHTVGRRIAKQQL